MSFDKETLYWLSIIGGALGGFLYYGYVETDYNCKFISSVVAVLWCIAIFYFIDTKSVHPLIITLISTLFAWHLMHIIDSFDSSKSHTK